MSSWMVPGYAQERELGQGASGRVVAAVHVLSGQRVAIKYLTPRLAGDPKFLAGFRAEAALLRSLDVPQVVRFLDYVEAPGLGAAIVMELVDGVSLRQVIARDGPASPESALAVLKGSLLGLAAAHALGIVHRDYKPENVLVDGDGNSKLSDFGVAVRAGRGSPGIGTPLYMAPEQWAGAPATPATDIYAASAVFYECLTGKAPFAGRIGQLRRQHTGDAVPVDQVDEPLRPLITRGMAKDPAARPGNALEFVSELETTAAAARGQDWESRGRGHLAARAAALLLLLLRAPTVTAGGTSSTSTYTTLAAPKATAAKAAAAKGGTGLSGMQMAIAGTALIVAVAAGAAGGWVLGKHHKAAPGPTRTTSGSPASPSASPTTATALSSPACGSGPPPLAYEALGKGPAATVSVIVRCGSGTPQSLGTFEYGASGMAWSADATQLAWLTGPRLEVAQAKAGKWTLRSWSCQGCLGVAFLGDHAVTVAPQPTGTVPQPQARTQLLVFPSSGSGQPATLPVTGLPADPLLFTRFWLLGNVSPTELVVDYGDAGGSDAGNDQLLFHVNSAGQAVQYGHATVSQNPAAPDTIFGAVGDFTVNQPGSVIAFTTYSQSGINCQRHIANVLDTATGAMTVPKVPAGGGPDGWLVQGIWFDRTGTPYVSLVPNQGDCTTGNPPAGGPTPAGVAPIVCKLSGDSWVQASSGVFQTAYGPGSWQAEQTGVTPKNDTANFGRTLTISGGTGTTPAAIAAVTSFAWAPYAAPPTSAATPTPAATGTPTASVSAATPGPTAATPAAAPT